MRKRIGIAVSLLFLAMLIVRTHAEDGASAVPAVVEVFPADTGISKELHFNAVALDKAIDQFSRATHLNVVVDWKTIEATGFRRSTPITLRLYDVPQKTALQLMLTQAADSNGATTLGFREEDQQIIHVTTSEAAQDGAVLRMYDVRDLISRFFDPQGKESETAARDPVAVQLRSDTIVQLIMRVVDPAQWRDNGAAVGSAHVYAGHLFISQTPENHRKIEQLLNNLRRITDSRAKSEPPTTRGIDLLARPVAPPAKP